jgi:hypothetical protein
MSDLKKPVRLFFEKSYEFVTAEGGRLLYRAGEYYHVAEEHVAHFLQLEVAKTERSLELEAEAAKAEAAEDAAKAEAQPAEPAPAE